MPVFFGANVPSVLKSASKGTEFPETRAEKGDSDEKEKEWIHPNTQRTRSVRN
jgi:hypothetical protein